MKIKIIYIVALLLLVLIQFNGFGQKCNFEKNEIDGITELPIKITNPELLLRINGQPMYAKAQCIGNNKYLKLVFYKYNDFNFQEQREIGLILSNHEEITLYPRSMPVDSAYIEAYEKTALLVYKLTPDQYAALKKSPVIKFKYFLVSGFIEEDIKTSNQITLVNLLHCVE